MNNFPFVGVPYGSNENNGVIYGLAAPILDDQYDYFPAEKSNEFVVPAVPASFAYASSVDGSSAATAYESEGDLFDIIEILAEESDNCEKVPVAIASEAEDGMVFSDNELIYEAFSYAVPVPEAQQVFEEQKKQYYEDDFALDCVAAFESMDMSGDDNKKQVEKQKSINVIAAQDIQLASNELFKVGTIDIDYLKSLHDAEEKRQRRKEAINRWQVKKNKRKSDIKRTVKNSVNSITDAVNSAAAACSTVLNARQKATAKRERENGKFKKAQVKWVSVTELFNTFDEFK